MVIVDFDAVYTIDASKFVSKGKNTPFHGKKVWGRVLKTLVDGNVVYDYEQENEREQRREKGWKNYDK